MLDASGSEQTTGTYGSRMNLMKIGAEKRCSFCGLVWDFFSSTVLAYLLGGNGTHTAT